MQPIASDPGEGFGPALGQVCCPLDGNTGSSLAASEGVSPAGASGELHDAALRLGETAAASQAPHQAGGIASHLPSHLWESLSTHAMTAAAGPGHFFRNLFATDATPRAICVNQDQAIIWTHIIGDVGIILAYYSIPLALLYFLWRRRDVAFHWIFVMFAFFIMSCGTAHIFGITAFWWPTYRAEGLAKMITAGISLSTAAALWLVMPRALALPSPRQVRDVNEVLQREVDERRHAQAELQQANHRVQSAYAEIEERVKARTIELAASEQRFRATFDLAPLGIGHRTLDGRWVRANRKLCSILGYSEEELKARTNEELTHPDDRDQARERLESLVNGRVESYSIEKRYIRSDGLPVWVRATMTLVREPEGGEAPYCIALIEDITEERKAAEMMGRHQRELARSHGELQDFAYVVSHDLKEPLRGISNFAAFIEEDGADQLQEPEREKLKTIRRLAQRTHHLLDALLESTRLGHGEIHYQNVDLAGLCREVMENLSVRIRDEGAQVICDPSVHREVRTDPALLINILNNLVANGLKYNRSNPKRVEIGVVETAKGGMGGLGGVGGVAVGSMAGAHSGGVIYVRDNGIGIPPQHQQRIFQMFKRLHGRDEFGGGIGAGLAIVRKIVERHGGQIWVDSTPGEGTTFYFTLHPPVRPGRWREVGRGQASEQSGRGTPGRTGPRLVAPEPEVPEQEADA